MAICYWKYKTNGCIEDSSWILHRKCGIPFLTRDRVWELWSFELTQTARRIGIGPRYSGKVWNASSFSGCRHDDRCSCRDIRCCVDLAEHGDVALLRERRKHSGDDHAGCKGYRDAARAAPYEPTSGRVGRPGCRVEDLRRRPEVGRKPTEKAAAMRLFLRPRLAWACKDAES